MSDAVERSTNGAPDLGFYFDLGSPFAYIAAERISAAFAEVELPQPEWRPVLLGALLKRFDRTSWALGADRPDGVAEIERRGAAIGLPPIRWPDPWPSNYLSAMRAATYAKSVGRTVSFGLAAFRQAFAAGRDLGDPDNLIVAAAATEIHPRALLKGIETEAIKRALRTGTDEAARRGVVGVPTVSVGANLFWGEDRLDDAVEAARLVYRQPL